MATQLFLSSGFLQDLDIVCPRLTQGRHSKEFFEDLEIAYRHARAASPLQQDISLADLTELEGKLKTWRDQSQKRLDYLLTQLPKDDPLRSPVSLFGPMDFGRLEIAHTRTLAWLLDDKEHGFGFQLLEALLNHLWDGEAIRLKNATVESEHPITVGPRRADSGRIDIFAKG